MNIKDFKNIKKLKEIEINSSNLKVGDFFVHGEKMIEQLESKKIGDNVSFFKVISIKNNGNVIYTPIIEKMGE